LEEKRKPNCQVAAETLLVAAAVVETLATGAVEETLAAAAYMAAAVEALAAAAVEALAAAAVEALAAAAMEALAAAAMVPWRSLWRRGEERMRLELDIFRSRFLRMLIYHVPMNLAICYTGRGVAAV
jgi:hypothetical protein